MFILKNLVNPVKGVPFMLKALYTIFAVGVVSLYSVAAMLGWEISGGSRHQLPPDARQNGYRSFHFWHYGLHGGK